MEIKAITVNAAVMAPELELRAQVLNINDGFNENLKEQCRTLAEYMQYVDKVRAYAKSMALGKAADRREKVKAE